MARYSQRLGPAAPFELTASMQTITGLSITRFFDNGELLISYYAQLFNSTVIDPDGFYQVTLDGAVIPASQLNRVMWGNSTFTDVCKTFLHSISAGVHTLAFQAQGTAAAGETIAANNALLTIVQLPLWDQDDDIITL